MEPWPKVRPLLAAVVVAAQAGGAGRAGGVEAAEHPVADGDPLDVVAGRQHRADELVADREARLDRDPAVVDVEVGAADPARLDPDQGLVGGADLGIGLLLDPDLAGRLEGDGAHRRANRIARPRQASADAVTPATWKRSELAVGAGGLGDPRLQRQLLLEVGRLAVLEGDVLALEQLDEDLDEAGVELFAGDAAQLAIAS